MAVPTLAVPVVGAGVYSALPALGIHHGATLALLGEVVGRVADSDSLRAGRSAMSRRGIELEYEQRLRIVNAFGGRWGYVAGRVAARRP